MKKMTKRIKKVKRIRKAQRVKILKRKTIAFSSININSPIACRRIRTPSMKLKKTEEKWLLTPV